MSNLMDTFVAKYGQSEDIRVVKSPLRICPIGAHSDYQGGRVIKLMEDSKLILIRNLKYAGGIHER